MLNRSFPFRAALAAAVVLTAFTPLAAQQRVGEWQVRVSSGRFVATGAQRATAQDAPVIAAQVSRTVSPNLALIATLGWARSRDLTTAATPKLDILSADLGLEGRVARWSLGGSTTFTPFVGTGVGARSYDTRAAGAASAWGGYLAAGGELGIGRVGLRLEVRDYATHHGRVNAFRNDVVVMGAIRFNRNRIP